MATCEVESLKISPVTESQISVGTSQYVELLHPVTCVSVKLKFVFHCKPAKTSG